MSACLMVHTLGACDDANMYVLAAPATRQGHGASAHGAGGHVTSPASMRSTKMFSESSKVPRCNGPGAVTDLERMPHQAMLRISL